MSLIIAPLTAADVQESLLPLAALLRDVVNSGAAVGFLPPLAADEAHDYWLGVAKEVQGGSRLLLVARDAATPEMLGTVQLDLATRTNGRHRAEVAKMLVHTSARRRGIARQLLQALEAQARQLGRSTLVLDTREGDVSEQLYQSMDYQRAGRIPEYAYSADGSLHATVLYYKLLPKVSEAAA
jgi:acetyltransferase